MAAHFNTTNPNTRTPGYVLLNHIYGRTVEVRSTTVVTPTTIFSQTVTTTNQHLFFPTVQANGFSAFSRIYPVTVTTQISANQGFQSMPSDNFLSVPQGMPIGGGFSPLTGTVMSSQGSYEAAAPWDGRIHSLPTQKYGPYACPKCNNVSMTSQAFAAHVQTHYRNETLEETRARLAARKRKTKTTLQGYGGATLGSMNHWKASSNNDSESQAGTRGLKLLDGGDK